MKAKICTSLEQSRKLIELGIDVSTADMWYPPSLIEYGVVKKWWENPTIVKDIERSNFKKEYYIPAWSLSALLKLMPKSIISTPNPFSDSYCCRNVEFDKESYGDNPVDAAFETLSWLLENKKI